MTTPTLTLVRQAAASPDLTLRTIAVPVDRITLAKRLWRGAADDGREFGFELNQPLKHGETILQTSDVRYVIDQKPESLIEISLEIAPSAAAGIGWAIGNLHLELSAEPARLLAPDEPALRQLLARLTVPYRVTTGVFRPGRFSRGDHAAHELGQSHKH